MTRALVVVGAGGHGRELLDVVEAGAAASPGSVELVGVVDDAPSEVNLARLAERGVPFLGDVDAWLASASPGVRYLLGVGSGDSRRALDERFTAAGLEPATAVHPAAVVGSEVLLAPGVVVLAGAVVATNTRVGRHTHVHRSANVGHDCVLGAYVTVNPSASISGDCVVEDDVLVGVGASVLQGLTLRRGATVGGGACVVKDVPEKTVVKGVPAR